MSDGGGANAWVYLVLLVLPISALVARRVPLVRVATMLATWAALFVVIALIVAQREKFDPYLARVTSIVHLSEQQVVGREVRIRMSADGHFWANVTVGGVSRRMLIDSGATLTALSTETADAMGLRVEQPMFPVVLQTANGQVSAKTATIGEMRLGNIIARDLPAVVAPAFGDIDVLGMNFLSRLQSWRVEGSTLVLIPHNPQGFT